MSNANEYQRCVRLLQPALNQKLMTRNNLDFILAYCKNTRDVLRKDPGRANRLSKLFKVLNGGMTVYHGVHKTNEYVNNLIGSKVGNVILLKDYIPTSRIRKKANWFCRRGNEKDPGICDGEMWIHLVLQFELPRGFPHLPVTNVLRGSPWSHVDYWQESEILLPRGMEYEVKSITNDKGVRTITLVPINRNRQNQQNPPHKKRKVEGPPQQENLARALVEFLERQTQQTPPQT